MKSVSALVAAIALAQAMLLSQFDSAVAGASCPRMLRGSVALAAEALSAEISTETAGVANQEDEEMHKKKQKIIVKKIAIPVPVPVEVPQYVAVPIPIAQPASAIVSNSANTVVSDTNVATSDTAAAPGAPGVPGIPGVTPAQTRPGEQPQATPAVSVPRLTPARTVPVGLAGTGADGIGGAPDNGALGMTNGGDQDTANMPQNRWRGLRRL